ncbi:MAG: flavodoxin family protein [Methanobrevibacter sp.]|nr:flavodoxin family protein [Methanobrevibacter sp.]
MKILALIGSPRKNSNCEIIVDEIAKGAAENGHEVVKYIIQDLDIAPCSGCELCRKGKDCRYVDDGTEIIDQLADGASVILASPIYFGQMSAQAKTIVDRFYSIFNNPNKSFSEDAKAAVVLTHAYPGDYDAYLQLTIAQPFQNNTEMEFIGAIDAGDVKFPGDVKEKPDILKEAYELGKKF